MGPGPTSGQLALKTYNATEFREAQLKWCRQHMDLTVSDWGKLCSQMNPNAP